MRAFKVLSLRGSSSKKDKTSSESPQKDLKIEAKKEPLSEPKSPKSPKSPLVDPIKVCCFGFLKFKLINKY